MKLLQVISAKFIRNDLNETDRVGIVRGIIQSFIIQGMSVILVFIGNFLLVRFAGADSYGLYIHIFNWISILTILALGGQDDVVLASIPKCRSENNLLQIGSIVKNGNLRIFYISLIVTTLFLILIYVFPIGTLSEHRNEFLTATATIYLSAFLILNQNILQSLNYIRLSQVVDRVVKPLLLITLIYYFNLQKVKLDTHHLIVITIIGLVVCVLVLLYIVIKKTRKYFASQEKPYQKTKVATQSLYFFFISLLYLLSVKVCMLLLPYFAAQKYVGIFNVSSRFADLIIYPFFLMHSVLPQVFARHHSSDVSYKQSLYNESTKLLIILSLPLLLLNIIAGKFMLGYFGNEFVTGYTALIYLSLSNFLFAIFGPANTILMMQGMEKYSALSLMMYVLILFILSLFLIPAWGITGAALSMLISNLLYNLLLSFFVFYFTGVVSPYFRIIMGRRKIK